MSRFTEKFVPRLLTDEQKQNGKAISQELEAENLKKVAAKIQKFYLSSLKNYFTHTHVVLLMCP